MFKQAENLQITPQEEKMNICMTFKKLRNKISSKTKKKKKYGKYKTKNQA